MHFFSANYIFPIHHSPVKNGILVVEEDGKISGLLDPEKDEIPVALPVRKFEGILCPGFINAHCHLELAHLKGKLTRKKQLMHFITEIIQYREEEKEIIQAAMKEADSEMFQAGIVAVGDISNTAFSGFVKTTSRIYYHTFIELFDITGNRTNEVFAKGLGIKKQFSEKGLKSSLVPHAPYTVTEGLLKLIAGEADKHGEPICIHNQETSSENEMFRNGKGLLLEKLRYLNAAYKDWTPTGKTSLATILERINRDQAIQFVHNTFTGREDVDLSKQFKNIFWCLCVRANLFIEDALPDISLFLTEKLTCTIGTDSLASNDSLSLLSELKVIQSHFSDISMNQLLTMASLNGAEFLKAEDRLGTFEKGKTPGVNWISKIDLLNLVFTENSSLQRIV